MAGIKLSVDRLQPGVFIHLPLRWAEHPFLFSSFKIKDEAQIALLKQLNITYVIYIPDKSSAEPLSASALNDEPEVKLELDSVEKALWDEKQARIEQLKEYRRSLQKCEKDFERSAKEVRSLLSKVTSRPLNAVADAEALIDSMVEALLSQDDLLLHLMGDGKEGDNFYYHSLNVSVLTMLLGKAKGYDAAQIKVLGMAGLFHDIGKLKIPSQIIHKKTALTEPEKNFLQLHPKYAVDLLSHVENFSASVVTAIYQHHEYADGTGYPKKLKHEEIDELAQLMALVNEYDSLCHPVDISKQRTPYAVLSYLFKNRKAKFNLKDIELMIRQLGIYPPGTVVQLSNSQVGMVISVNQSKLLQPNVLLYDPAIPRTEAPIVALDDVELTINKAIDPKRLPEKAFEYLNPRTRVNYYFEASPNK